MNLKIHLLVVVLIFFSSASSFAASVSAVKGQKVLINLDGDSVTEGDEFYLINPDSNKRSALIRIKQVRDSKALGEIVKGRAAAGYSLQAKGSSPMSAEVGASGDSGSRDSGYSYSMKNSYGILGSYIMNSMSADVTYKDSFGASKKSSASMSGMGLGVGAFYDYTLSSDFVARGYGAIEQFNVAGSAADAACSGSTNCDAKIMYVSLYGLFKWYPLPGKYRGWVGGGGGYLFAASKSSTALNESQISTNQVITLAVGLDVQTSRKNYIPISLEYNLFPPSETVKASSIQIKAGWAWNL